jgi:hypothetical protein
MSPTGHARGQGERTQRPTFPLKPGRLAICMMPQGACTRSLFSFLRSRTCTTGALSGRDFRAPLPGEWARCPSGRGARRGSRPLLRTPVSLSGCPPPAGAPPDLLSPPSHRLREELVPFQSRVQNHRRQDGSGTSWRYYVHRSARHLMHRCRYAWPAHLRVPEGSKDCLEGGGNEGMACSPGPILRSGPGRRWLSSGDRG